LNRCLRAEQAQLAELERTEGVSMDELYNGLFNKTIEKAVQDAAGSSWTIEEVVKNGSMAMHPAILCKGKHQNVFVKAGSFSYSYEQFQKEATGLRYISEHSQAATPEIYGVVKQGDTTLLIMEAVPVKPVETKQDWEVLGRGLAILHKTVGEKAGFQEDNYLGILPQPNDYRSSWIEFYGDVRLRTMLERTIATGYLTEEEALPVYRLIERLPELDIPPQPFSLLHGDPWTGMEEPGNLLYDGKRLVMIDCSIYYGNREIDLSTVDLFYPVHPWFFEAYHEEYPIAEGYEERRELWRLNQKISFVALFGRRMIPQLYEAVNRYM